MYVCMYMLKSVIIKMLKVKVNLQYSNKISYFRANKIKTIKT